MGAAMVLAVVASLLLAGCGGGGDDDDGGEGGARFEPALYTPAVSGHGRRFQTPADSPRSSS
jgi:hypothetical protein